MFGVNPLGNLTFKAQMCVTQKRAAAAERRLSVGFLSNMRDTITHRLGHSAIFSLSASCRPAAPERLLAPGANTQTSEVDVTSIFLPEFPLRLFPEQEHYRVPPTSAGEG